MTSTGTLELRGVSFLLDGMPISGFDQIGDSVLLAERESWLLEAILRDGSYQQLVLNPVNAAGIDYVDPAAQLQLVQSSYFADFNGDGEVDGDDLANWRNDFGQHDLSDADGDGDSDGADFLAWQQQFGNGAPNWPAAQAVPEPGLASLLIAGGLLLHVTRARRAIPNAAR